VVIQLISFNFKIFNEDICINLLIFHMEEIPLETNGCLILS